jgi:rod shape determining protein RodA
MSIYSNHRRRDKFRENFGQFDRILTFSVAGLLIIGTLLVYAATRNWFAAQGLDPE